MERYIWLFPILFIFHDFEEIIGFKIWLKKNKEMLENKFPKVIKTYANHSTEGMALAIYEELLVSIGISLFALYLKKYELWLGVFIAYTVHLGIHILQTFIVGKYIPAVITSIMALPISIWVINKCLLILDYPVITIVLYSILGCVMVALNLKFVHMIMRKFTVRMQEFI